MFGSNISGRMLRKRVYPLVGQACNEEAGIKIPEFRNGRDHPVDVFNLGDEGRALKNSK